MGSPSVVSAHLKRRVRQEALASSSPEKRMHRFGQVIAADVQFQLATRVWCIAELYEADRSHLDQKMKIYTKLSENDQADTLQKIKTLNVADAEASFPADRDLVLAKIDNVHVFNTKVRSLVVKRMSRHIGGVHMMDAQVLDTLW